MNPQIKQVLISFINNELHRNIKKIDLLSENVSGFTYLLEDSNQKKNIIKVVEADSLYPLYGFDNAQNLAQFIKEHMDMVATLCRSIPSPKTVVINGSLLQSYQGLLFYFTEFIDGKCKDIDHTRDTEKMVIAQIMSTIHKTDVSMYNRTLWETKIRFMANAWHYFLQSGAPALLTNYLQEWGDSSLVPFIDSVCTTVSYESIIGQLDKGVLAHTDIKPKNVLWNSENQPIIIDWDDTCVVRAEIDFIDTITSWTIKKQPHEYKFLLDEAQTFRSAYDLTLSISELDVLSSAAKWMFWICNCIQLNKKEEIADGFKMLHLINKNCGLLMSL